MYTAGIKIQLPFLPALGNFNYTRGVFEDFIRWEHRVNDAGLKEWHREMFANSSGEGLDGSMEAVVRRLKHSITSFTLSAIENADWMASMSSNVTATLKVRD
jgi:hypothetical protein